MSPIEGERVCVHSPLSSAGPEEETKACSVENCTALVKKENHSNTLDVMTQRVSLCFRGCLNMEEVGTVR